MTYSYEKVSIGSTQYSVYGDVASAKLYLQADISGPATAWLATDSLTQGRSLIAAVRWMDQQGWLGQPTDIITPQDLAWPRINVIDQYGQAIDPNTIPPQIAFAEFELAAGLVDNPDLRQQLQDTTPSQLQAGSVQITYFRPPGVAYGGKDVQTLTVFPQNVMDLVGIWLAGVGSAQSPVLTKGTHDKNELWDDYPGVIHGF